MAKRARTATPRRPRDGSLARPIFLLVLVGIAQAVFFTSALFRLSSVEVLGCYQLTRLEVLAAAGLTPGSLLYAVPLQAAEQRVRRLHWVQDAAVRRSLPGRVTIRIAERNPVLAVRNVEVPSDYPHGWHVVSADGMVLALATTEAHARLPRCCVPQELEVGKRIQPALVDTILRVRKALPPDLEPRVSELRADADEQLELVLQLVGRPTPIRLGGADKIAHKFEVLGAMLDRITLEGKPVSYVDLRFNDPAAGHLPVATKTATPASAAGVGVPAPTSTPSSVPLPATLPPQERPHP